MSEQRVPKIPSLPKPMSSSKHWDAGIDRPLAGERAARLEREDQLREALGQLATLTAENADLKAQVASGGFYVASRASIPERGAMWRALRSSGVPITASWIDEDGEGETDFTELWSRIESEIRKSQALILYAEGGDFPLKGAFIEAGMALAMGKLVFAVLPGVALSLPSMRPVGSWLAHPNVRIVATVQDALIASRTAPVTPNAPQPKENPICQHKHNSAS